MENVAEVQSATITTLKLPKIAEFKTKQELIVEKHPFVEIIDNETFKQAKVNRTALKTARTGIQKGSKVLASRINDFKRNAKDIEGRLILITSVHEEKQQAEIDRWEEKKADEKAEKLRIAEIKKQADIDKVNEFFLPLAKMVMVLNFHDIEDWNESIKRQIREKEIEGGFGEAEELFATSKQILLEKLSEKIQSLNKIESQRIEDERLVEERRIFEEQKAKDKAEKEAQEKIEAEKKAKEDAIRKAEDGKRVEAQRKLDEEKAEFEAKKKAEQKAIDDEKKRLEKIELDRLAKIEAEKQVKLKAEKEKKEAEEKAIAKAKKDAELKAEKEAEEKRQLALRPDVEKLETAINQISFSTQELSQTSSKQFQQDIIQGLENFKEELINKLQNL